MPGLSYPGPRLVGRYGFLSCLGVFVGPEFWTLYDLRPNAEGEMEKNLSVFEICLNHPLYEKVEYLEEDDIDPLYDFFYFKGKQDGYCVGCKAETVFSLEQSLHEKLGLDYSDEQENDRYFSIQFKCARVDSHSPIFYFLQLGRKIQKIGQHPSLADTAIGQLDRFRKILDADNSREFHKALGLAAHDVGIGAFVYLRRVLERLIDARKAKAVNDGPLTEADFEKKRVSEKIKLLKGYLPDTLVDNDGIYRVLSKGVHELSEEECLQYFTPLRDLMFLILEEDLEKEKKDKFKLDAIAGLAKFQPKK